MKRGLTTEDWVGVLTALLIAMCVFYLFGIFVWAVSELVA